MGDRAHAENTGRLTGLLLGNLSKDSPGGSYGN